VIPSDFLKEVFPAEMLERLRSHAEKNEGVSDRLEILAASGPEPSDPWKQHRLRYCRRNKAAWDAYLTGAYAVGLLGSGHADDLLARLRSPSNDSFRAAMAECMAAWFLAGKMSFDVKARPMGRKGHILELQVNLPDRTVYVEVKSPREESSDVIDLAVSYSRLKRSLEEANKQFRRSVPNLLVIAPDFPIPIFEYRGQLTNALFGHQEIVIPIDRNAGKAAGEPRIEFKASGHLMSRQLPSGKYYKLDRRPRFTRIGAVLTIEEIQREQFIDHEALIVHNPHAPDECRIPETVWHGIPQFVAREGNMQWTDEADPWFPDTSP
jgi:hypothetical protein